MQYIMPVKYGNLQINGIFVWEIMNYQVQLREYKNLDRHTHEKIDVSNLHKRL